MDLLANLGVGAQVALLPQNILYCFIGVFTGTMVGVLPGLGPLATIALLLPITFTLDPIAAIVMLAGIYYGAQYGGSITAILMNLPGEASSVVTAIDGHRMARNGVAGAALAAAAISSFAAGTLATVIIALFAPPLSTLALRFGAPEYFALMVLGLVASIVLAHGSVLKAVSMVLLGILLGLVGTELTSGMTRLTFGVRELGSGISILALAMGIFALAEVARSIGDLGGNGAASIHKLTSVMLNREQYRRIAMPTARGTLLGSILGVLPGGGATLASFAAYSLDKKVSRFRHEFGSGAIEGVAAPESANNAAAQTAFIPMLTLGIPSNPVMALIIGALILQGIQPGPGIISSQPELFWALVVSMWLGNFFLIALNLPLVGVWVMLLRVPYRLLFPVIVVMSVIGVSSINNSTFDVMLMALFGVLGYFLISYDYEPAPLLLGFILGPMMEEYFLRALTISRGDPWVFVQSPISIGLLATAVLCLVVTLLPNINRKRDAIFAE